MENEVEGTSTEIKDPAAVLAALDRAKNDAKRFREEKEAADQEFAALKAKADLIQSKLKRDKIINGLKEAGIKDGDRLLKYIKTDEIQLTDELEIAGLEAQLESLKEEFPEIFNVKKIVGGKANSSTVEAVETPLSASEIQAMRILGR